MGTNFLTGSSPSLSRKTLAKVPCSTVSILMSSMYLKIHGCPWSSVPHEDVAFVIPNLEVYPYLNQNEFLFFSLIYTLYTSLSIGYHIDKAVPSFLQCASIWATWKGPVSFTELKLHSPYITDAMIAMSRNTQYMTRATTLNTSIIIRTIYAINAIINTQLKSLIPSTMAPTSMTTRITPTRMKLQSHSWRPYVIARAIPKK